MNVADGFSADDLVRATKIVFTEFGLPKKTVSDAGMHFVSDCFKQFCRKVSIDQTITSSYHHQHNVKVEACIKFLKHTIENTLIALCNSSCFVTDRLMPIGTGLSSPATLM